MTLAATAKKHAMAIAKIQSGLLMALAAAARTAGGDFIVSDLCWGGVGRHDADRELPGHFRAPGRRFSGNKLQHVALQDQAGVAGPRASGRDGGVSHCT